MYTSQATFSQAKGGRRKWIQAGGIVAATALALVGCANADGGGGDGDGDGGDTPFYEGKTITLLVPTDAGGTVDTAARFVGEFLSKHVEGNPEVVIDNVTGGNQMVGANEYAQRRAHDGTELFMNGNGTTMYELLDHADAQFSYADYTPVIGFGGTAMLASNDESGIETIEDLGAADRPIYGGLAPGGTDLPNLLAFKLLELDVESVFGYESNPSKRLAFLQGEMDLSSDSTTSFLREMGEEFESGQLQFLYSYGAMNEDGTLGRDPLEPDVPNVAEVYETLHGSPVDMDSIEYQAYMTIISARALANTTWIFSDAPEEAISALQDGVQAMTEDADFTASLDAAVGGAAPVPTQGMQAPVNAVLNPDPEVLEWVKDFLRDEHDAEL